MDEYEWWIPVDVSLLCLTAVVSAGVSLIVAVWTTVCTPDSSPDETPRDAHRKFIIGNLSGIGYYRTSVIIKPKSVSNISKFQDFCLEQFFFRDFQKLSGPQNQSFRMFGSVDDTYS